MAVAAPMPELAPVTRTILSRNEVLTELLWCVVVRPRLIWFGSLQFAR
jgi:hypothetical protein